jgi:hypothetical protein
MIDPQYLKQLMPDVQWEKLGRKEPIGVRALLQKDGIQITNVQQLQEFGLTNYTIRRAQPQAQPQAQPGQPPAPEVR